jgi:hypothetical protein
MSPSVEGLGFSQHFPNIRHHGITCFMTISLFICNSLVKDFQKKPDIITVHGSQCHLPAPERKCKHKDKALDKPDVTSPEHETFFLLRRDNDKCYKVIKETSTPD